MLLALEVFALVDQFFRPVPEALFPVPAIFVGALALS